MAEFVVPTGQRVPRQSPRCKNAAGNGARDHICGEGSELRRPLGIAIVGGLIVSQMLTLYTTPVIYLYLDRFSLWCRRRWSSAPRPVTASDNPVPGE